MLDGLVAPTSFMYMSDTGLWVEILVDRGDIVPKPVTVTIENASACSEVGGIDRRTLLLDTGDLVGERGSTDLMVGPLTALTDTRIRYSCTAVQICAERIRPLDPLRAPPTVRSLP
jgi:hypothetical protein